jgi:hypothetical protein
MEFIFFRPEFIPGYHFGPGIERDRSGIIFTHRYFETGSGTSSPQIELDKRVRRTEEGGLETERRERRKLKGKEKSQKIHLLIFFQGTCSSACRDGGSPKNYKVCRKRE